MDLTNSETTTQPGQPALTVVLPTIDNCQRIQKTLTHLQAQTARSEIEVLIVASSEGALKLDPAVAEGFFDLRVIEVGEIHSLAVAKSLAAAEARADWVVFGEVTGYTLGKGDAENQYLEFEARRFEAITRQDRDALGIELPQPDNREP